MQPLEPAAQRAVQTVARAACVQFRGAVKLSKQPRLSQLCRKLCGQLNSSCMFAEELCSQPAKCLASRVLSSQLLSTCITLQKHEEESGHCLFVTLLERRRHSE